MKDTGKMEVGAERPGFRGEFEERETRREWTKLIEVLPLADQQIGILLIDPGEPADDVAKVRADAEIAGAANIYRNSQGRNARGRSGHRFEIVSASQRW
jgi:hypothetical protein